ncbi:MAG: histidine--tRNA ligase [Desulfovibrio sp.]
MAKIQKIKGFVDLFPEESARFSFMETVARDTFNRYAFGELRTPILEKTDVFAKAIGEDTDVVGKEMYTFPDRKNRSLTMRPEATAGVVRAFVESKTHQPGKISRYFTFGPMFRYERPQKGRQRQFHQINAEMFGASEPQADAEVILMLSDFLKGIGLKKLAFEINSLGCPECRPVYRQALTDFYKGLEFENFCEDCKRRSESNPMRVLDCKVPACKEMVKDAPKISDHLCGECEDHFAVVLEIITAAGLEYELNPRLVRGLDYYQRTTFEVTSSDIGSQTAVAGGGRYDGLVKQLGGAEVPGVGFACGMERLALLLEQMDESGRMAKPDFFVAVVDDAACNAAIGFAQKLRGKGLSGECNFSAGSMKSRMRQAGKSGAQITAIFGGSELADGTVTLKYMEADKEQETLAQDTAVETIVSFVSAK